MDTSPAPPVADKRSRVGLLVMDGLLIVLMGWLLYTVVAARDAAEKEANAATQDAAGSSTDAPVEAGAAGAPSDEE